MAAILDRAVTHLVARIHPEWEFGNDCYVVGSAPLGASDGTAVVDYIRLRGFWCWFDFADSVRDAPAFFEVRLRVGRRARVQQQYRGLTARLQHALLGRPYEKAVSAGERTEHA